MRAVCGQRDRTQAIAVLLPKVIQLRGGMSGRIIHNDKPKRVGLAVNEAFQVCPDFLMAFAFMDGIHARAIRIDQAAEQRIPGIGVPWAVDLGLAALRDIAQSHIRAPVEIGTIKEHQFRVFRRLSGIAVRSIMTAQNPLFGFFLNASIRSRLTVYKGSGDVTLSLPRFNRTP